MPTRGQPSHPSGKTRFHVALSFPGEARPEVREVARLLREALGQDRVFYDEYHKAELARPNLDVHLQRIYRDDSLLVVLFVSADYAEKEWCGLEWRAIRDLIKAKHDSQVMPVRLDNTQIPGLFSIDGYIDFREHTGQEVAQLVLERVEKLRAEADQV